MERNLLPKGRQRIGSEQWINWGRSGTSMSLLRLAIGSGEDQRRALWLAVLLAAAAAVYSYRLGHEPLGASEAYSALAASQPTVAQVAHSALSLDPGKPVLYHLLLHWFCGWFGMSETSLRALSVCFGIASVWLVFALARELFGFEVGIAAAILWAFNPLAVIFARWARMYSMLVALALGHLLALSKARRYASAGMLLLAGLLGGAMLYTHFGGILIVGADLVVVLREFRREGRSAAWPAVALACLVFAPFAPVAIAQSRALLFGHWLDWLGVGHAAGMGVWVLGPVAAALALWVALGCRGAGERRESLQRCLIYATLPALALAVGSILLRPMLEARYLSPSIAMVAVVAAYWLDGRGVRVRNLGITALAALFVALLPFCYAGRPDPWRAIATRIAAGAHPAEPIFFEAGFFSPDTAAAGADDRGFPQGFFRVPFDYYFHESNPRAVVPPADPARARKLIQARVNSAGGAWLVSARKWPDAVAELPVGPDLEVDYAARFANAILFHVRRAG
jgi:4-amino-4-deoxy-L-arabinose transferase-like glycosyltransferase